MIKLYAKLNILVRHSNARVFKPVVLYGTSMTPTLNHETKRVSILVNISYLFNLHAQLRPGILLNYGYYHNIKETLWTPLEGNTLRKMRVPYGTLIGLPVG